MALQPLRKACVLLTMAAALAGCASLHRRGGASPESAAAPRTAQASAPVGPAPASLQEFIASVRGRSITAGVERPSPNLQLAEKADPVLRRALEDLAHGRTAVRHVAVAAAYLRLGIRDLAFDHFTAATALDAFDGAAYDGLARLWRDWGFPELGLVDAHRAVYRLPQSAAARNTLGTVLQALGLLAEARRAYVAAIALDPRAAWALNNLCSVDLALGRPLDAAGSCRRALALDPALLAARRNLVRRRIGWRGAGGAGAGRGEAARMSTMPAQPRAPILAHPAAPATLAEAGLPLDLVVQLSLKTLNYAGDLTGTELGRRLGLRFTVIEPAIDLLRSQRQVEVVSGSMVGPPSYGYRITDAGRARASLFLEQNHYLGVAPVPLAHYTSYLRAFRQALPRRKITRREVRAAFGHLVLSERVIDEIGPAVHAAHSMFVYGPPGNGKTVICQALRNLLEGELAIPHAIEVEGHIIRVFDPVVHEELPLHETGSLVSAHAADDFRWARCRRPVVTVGGELTLEALDLAYMPNQGFYRAPVQALANGGVLVVDDFGRQRCAARDLLNRWIVPLESRVDYLTLQTGQKFELPFLALAAFATNIRPRDLVDEAFLRRIRYKVFAASPSVEEFAAIFQNCCVDRSIEFDRGLVDRLLQDIYRPRRIPLRGCHPRDLIEQALSLAAYLNQPQRLTFALLQAACDSYFVDDGEE